MKINSHLFTREKYELSASLDEI